mmetsp:Transcript_15039/g.46705  ORF Transcript_15039/g.46705 Transcript_15039/m.46705 type:complete len:118 (+) Transcript_15039:480-833(+)
MNNLFHGDGIFTSSEFSLMSMPARGDRYEGRYEFGQKHGHGIFHHCDGAIYEGCFDDNLQVPGSMRVPYQYNIGFMEKARYRRRQVIRCLVPGTAGRLVATATSSLRVVMCRLCPSS